MNCIKITSPDICNGNGTRLTIWFSGCKHNCKNCQNKWLQDYNQGQPFSEFKDEIYDIVSNPYIDGITLSGGDPLCQDMESLVELGEFLRKFKEDFPVKNIWLYTGYTIEELEAQKDSNPMRYEVINLVDYLVDGRYDESKKDCGLAFRGSSNQRIFKMPEKVVVNDEDFRN